MEEKARLYAAMKRGDYVPSEHHNAEASSLVDFDRKWAENEAHGAGNELDTSSDDGGGSDDGEDQEMIEYTDEFGRQRMGNRAEVARMERRKRAQGYAAEELERFSARPVQPKNLIYGDTVQHAAFNPDEPVAAQMSALANRRDRSVTPPEATHYRAEKEVRSKGVGFYSFSKDEETRKKEMDALENERKETERGKQERKERKEKRRREVEQRRKEIGEKRGMRQADKFLESLEGEMRAAGGGGDEH
jgi:hypothetical protein